MNREITGGAAASIYPLTGDVLSTAGSPKVTVTGLQTIPVSTTAPTDKQVLVYNFSDGLWEPGEGSTSGHDEPLTDGNGNFIFAATLTTGGDIIVVTGIPD